MSEKTVRQLLEESLERSLSVLGRSLLDDKVDDQQLADAKVVKAFLDLSDRRPSIAAHLATRVASPTAAPAVPPSAPPVVPAPARVAPAALVPAAALAPRPTPAVPPRPTPPAERQAPQVIPPTLHPAHAEHIRKEAEKTRLSAEFEAARESLARQINEARHAEAVEADLEEGLPLGEPSNAEVKAWAQSRGLKVPARGAVSRDLRKAYTQAHKGGAR